MTRLLAMLAAVCFLAAACNNAGNTPAAQDSTKAPGADSMNNAGNMLEKNKATALASLEAVNNHDTAGVFKDVSSDFVDYGDGSGPAIKGADSGKVAMQMFISAFPDIKGENLMTVAEGNHVVIMGDWSGTFKGKMMNMAPTGKSFKMKDVDIFTFNDQGKITEHRNIQSMATIMSQVGTNRKK